ncbi:MAG TPA: tetratricopeptide repeat protein, partial [Sphingomonadales bacterium]|nr:tetratricopeptide repeat protein [Sphingomonadales bacterium]
MAEAAKPGGAAALLDEAFACFARGDGAGARKRFAELTGLSGVPREMLLQAHYQLGLMTLDAGEAARAATHFEKAHALSPEHPGLSLNFGKALLLSGSPAAALPHLQRAAGGDPQAAVWVARAHLFSGNAGEAAAQFDRLLPSLDPDPDVLCDVGLALERAGERNRATGIYGEVREKFPTHFDALVREAESLRSAHLYPAASRLLQTAARIAPADARKLHDLGLALHELGLKEEAEAAFNRSLKVQGTA